MEKNKIMLETVQTIENELQFIRGMIKGYAYFTEGTTKSKLVKIAEELDLPKESLYRFFLLNGKLHSFREPVQSYFLNWYKKEGFQSVEKVSDFLEEMEKSTQEFPIFDRVPRETIDKLVSEITEASGISPGSLWPLGYSRKDPASRKTFPFSDYWRLVRTRDEVNNRLTDRLYGVIDGSPYGSIISCILPFVVQLKDEFGFGYGDTIHTLVESFKRVKQLTSYEFRGIFGGPLVKGLQDYLSILRKNKENSWEVSFDPVAIEIRVSEAVDDTSATLPPALFSTRPHHRASRSYE